MLVINSGPIFTVSETSGDIRRKPQFFVPLYLMPPWVCYRRNSVTQFRLRKRQWWTYRVMKKVWWQVRPVRHNTIAWRTGGRTNISLLSGTWVMLTREKLIDVLNSKLSVEMLQNDWQSWRRPILCNSAVEIIQFWTMHLTGICTLQCPYSRAGKMQHTILQVMTVNHHSARKCFHTFACQW